MAIDFLSHHLPSDTLLPYEVESITGDPMISGPCPGMYAFYCQQHALELHSS